MIKANEEFVEENLKLHKKLEVIKTKVEIIKKLMELNDLLTNEKH